MNEIRVLIITREGVDDKSLDMLRQVSPRLAIESMTTKEAAERGIRWSDVEVLFTSDPLPKEGEAPRLRWIQGYYAGIDRWGRLPLTMPVVFTSTSGIHVQVAEAAMMLMLAFSRNLPLALELQKRAEWPKDRFSLFEPYELRDATAGIIGYGIIGRQLGTLCQAFGMRVLAVDRPEVLTVDPPWIIPGAGRAVPDRLYDPGDLKLLLKESDYVAICVPYTPQTHGMINADALAVMKPNAVLINVARGNVVDEPALIDALKAGTIRGAGLDVYSEEPLPSSSPIWKLPNVIACPHIAGLSPHYVRRAMMFFAENLRRYIAGEPLLNVVQKERGY
jgi:phosphoglycerate dehydrogenase-like enzyme